ncbi:glycosyltransferase family 4 protein [Cyanobacteria bacterium FACHB-471]|nr:glycosyltransferase family 4 protein [Cyanobacteria bacterium FACHB-471]
MTQRNSLKEPSPAIAAAPYLFIFLEIFAREGGIQSYVKDIFRSYSELTDVPEADVFLLRDGQDCSNPFATRSFRFRYLRTKSPRLGRIRLAIALLVYLVQHRPQQVFCGHVNLAPLVQLLCRPLGIPYTVLTYGKEVWTTLPKRDREALHHADQIWTISRYSRDRACEANGLNPNKVKFLPCVVNGDYFTPGAKSEALLKQYDLVDYKVLMTVARLWSGDIYKGVDVTIRALPAIAQVFPEVKYLVIGRGDDQPRLAQLAKDLGVEDQVVFAGFVPTEALVEHYRLADAYVMPSQEGFGIVYLEAMACGVPVLSGDADGSADPLQDGKLGWQVPHRNPEAVAHACIEMLKGCEQVNGVPSDRRCDGAWLREQAIALFGQDALTHKLHHLLQSSL